MGSLGGGFYGCGVLGECVGLAGGVHSGWLAFRKCYLQPGLCELKVADARGSWVPWQVSYVCAHGVGAQLTYHVFNEGLCCEGERAGKAVVRATGGLHLHAFGMWLFFAKYGGQERRLLHSLSYRFLLHTCKLVTLTAVCCHSCRYK